MADPAQSDPEDASQGVGVFTRYLTLWVVLCIVGGVLLGQLLPAVPRMLAEFTYAQVSIPIAILIWFMIYPMMVQIDFGSIVQVGRHGKGLIITLVVNWLIKPFTMLAFAWLFLRVIFAPFIEQGLATEYVAGAVILGAAPCTAMVFVWSYLTRGNPAYTLVQVALNDLVLLVAFAPIVIILLGISDIVVPFDTVLLSVVLYIVIPLAAGYISRVYLIRSRGIDWFDNVFLKRLGPLTIIGLLLTLVLLFSFQGDVIINNPLHIVLIAIPLTIQTIFIFAIAYGWAKLWQLPHNIAAPAALVGASNFFELAVATAIVLFGLTSGAALATVVGVLVEVPVMLMLVGIANRTRRHFPGGVAMPAIEVEEERLPFGHAILGIDFAPTTEPLVACMPELTQLGVTEITFIHVIDVDYPRAPEMEHVAHYERRLREVAAPVEEQGITIHTQVRVGDPTVEILSAAREQQASLIVLGSVGHSVFNEVVLGSVAGEVAQRATLPVLLFPVEAGAQNGERQCRVVSDKSIVEQLLYPTDFSDVAELAFDHVSRLAHRTRQITLLHVQDMTKATTNQQSHMEEQDRVDQARMERLRADLARLTDVEITVRIEQGAPGPTIVEVAHAIGASLILMGGQGQSFLGRALLGSVSNHVVRNARLPVLLIPPRQLERG